MKIWTNDMDAASLAQLENVARIWRGIEKRIPVGFA